MNQTSAPTANNPRHQKEHAPDWYALKLFNQYRLLLLVALAAVYYIAEDPLNLGSRDNTLFEITHLLYVVCALAYVYLHRVQTPSAITQFYLQNYLDTLLVCGLIYASGGLSSGLSPLLLINLCLLSQLTHLRHAILFAAIASMSVFSQALIAKLLLGTPISYEAITILSCLLIATAWIMCVPVRRLMNRQLVKSSSTRASLDVEQIAKLNEEIIRELDSGVVVVDSNNNVQQINDTARSMLCAEFTALPIPLKKLSPELFISSKQAERSISYESRPFDVIQTQQKLLPRFTRLSTAGLMIKLDDHAHIKQQYEQLKMASLGKLSASIATEIKDPLGLISQTIKLLEESETLTARDADLLQITKRNSQHISRILDGVLQLSNKQVASSMTVVVDDVVNDFAKRFANTYQLNPFQLTVKTERSLARIDPDHLDQVLWNLCSHVHGQNCPNDICISLSCWQPSLGVTTIEVQDNGKPISDIDMQNLFDPYYLSQQAGTGLGLYIIKELCDLNKAQIECLPSQTGAHFRLTLAAAQDMAA